MRVDIILTFFFFTKISILYVFFLIFSDPLPVLEQSVIQQQKVAKLQVSCLSVLCIWRTMASRTPQ